eukprot:m.136582 g.136582  ORF g.136582 m.136582 type:complete len:405 (-) comp29865_c0_seq1:231-1445(-)
MFRIVIATLVFACVSSSSAEEDCPFNFDQFDDQQASAVLWVSPGMTQYGCSTAHNQCYWKTLSDALEGCSAWGQCKTLYCTDVHGTSAGNTVCWARQGTIANMDREVGAISYLKTSSRRCNDPVQWSVADTGTSCSRHCKGFGASCSAVSLDNFVTQRISSATTVTNMVDELTCTAAIGSTSVRQIFPFVYGDDDCRTYHNVATSRNLVSCTAVSERAHVRRICPCHMLLTESPTSSPSQPPTYTTTSTTTTETATTHTIYADLNQQISNLLEAQYKQSETLANFVKNMETRMTSLETMATETKMDVAALSTASKDIRASIAKAVLQSPSFDDLALPQPSINCDGNVDDQKCVPAVYADGNGITLSALQNTVKFETGECGSINPCELHQAIRSIAAAMDSLKSL